MHIPLIIIWLFDVCTKIVSDALKNMPDHDKIVNLDTVIGFETSLLSLKQLNNGLTPEEQQQLKSSLVQ